MNGNDNNPTKPDDEIHREQADAIAYEIRSGRAMRQIDTRLAHKEAHRTLLINAVVDALSDELTRQEGVDLDLRELKRFNRDAHEIIARKVEEFADNLLSDSWPELVHLEDADVTSDEYVAEQIAARILQDMGEQPCARCDGLLNSAEHQGEHSGDPNRASSTELTDAIEDGGRELSPGLVALRDDRLGNYLAGFYGYIEAATDEEAFSRMVRLREVFAQHGYLSDSGLRHLHDAGGC